MSGGACGSILLFCGLPGTLKTYLATRLSARLGFAYLPTRAAGPLTSIVDGQALDEERRRRYERIAGMAAFLTGAGADVITDGGYPTRAARLEVLSAAPTERRFVIYCHCKDPEVRRQRLAQRAREVHDQEARSAQAILDQGALGSALNELPHFDLGKGDLQALLDVDTDSGEIFWSGEPPESLREILPGAIGAILSDYRARTVSSAHERLVSGHFEELAEGYDHSTSWRRDPVLLGHLERDLGKMPARILDLGTGTGLATEGYARQGHHVVGLDLSPSMLARAAPRLTVTVLGTTLASPFLPDYFDLVVVRQCLHYVDPERLLAEAYRVLRPGGWIAVSGVVAPHERSRRFWLELKAATQPLRLDVFTVVKLEALLERHRFEVECRLHHRIERVDSIERFRAQVPEPEGGWEAFLSTMVRLADQESPESVLRFEGDLLSHQQHWVTIWARK